MRNSAILRAASLLAPACLGCGAEPRQTSTTTPCTYSEARTTEVDLAVMPGGDALPTTLDSVQYAPATWWDGSATTLQLGFAVDPGAVVTEDRFVSSTGNETSCPTLTYWSVELSVVAFQTAEADLGVETDRATLQCDNNGNQGPLEGLNNYPCDERFTFLVPVVVDPTRTPADAPGPYQAWVTVDPSLPRGFSVRVVETPVVTDPATDTATTGPGTTPIPVELLHTE